MTSGHRLGEPADRTEVNHSISPVKQRPTDPPTRSEIWAAVPDRRRGGSTRSIRADPEWVGDTIWRGYGRLIWAV